MFIRERFADDGHMTWPAPTPIDLPPPLTHAAEPHRASTAPTAGPRPEPSELRRLVAAITPATWVALVGAALVLTAAGILAASAAGAWAAPVRAIAMVGIAVALAWASERHRRAVPTTAAVTAHVAAFLAAPAVIASASAVGATWPACLLLGGSAAVLSTEVQARRWRADTLHAGQVVAIALGATGAAALLGTTAGLLGGIAALALLTAGATRRAVALAAVAVGSPVLWTLADAGIGAGTLERAGIVGERLGWSGPVVGLLTATAFGIAAQRIRSNPLMLAAAAALVVGAATGLASVANGGGLWWTLPALTVLAAEAAWWLLPDRTRRSTGALVDAVAAVLAVGSLIAPLLVGAAGWIDDERTGLVPATLTAVALAFVALRCRVRASRLGDLAVGAAAVSSVAAAVALDLPDLALAVVAVAVAIGAAAIRRATPAAAVHPPTAWAAIMIVAADRSGGWQPVIAISLLALLAAVVVAVRARSITAAGVVGTGELALVVLAAALAASSIVDGEPGAAFLATIGVLVAIATLADRRLAGHAVAITGLGALLVAAVQVDSAATPLAWAGWATASAGMLVVGAVGRSRLAGHAAAGCVVGAVASALASVGVAPEHAIVSAMAAAAALTGIAVALGRRTPVDTAAVGATLVALGAAGLDVADVWTSAVWTLVGVQVVAAGWVLRRTAVQLMGAAITLAATLSVWFTSGANAWFLRLIEPADVTAGDVWLAVAALSMLAAGAAARRTTTVNSWLAYGPTFVVTVPWLTVVQLDRSTPWALPTAVVIGVAATALGAARRLAAVLAGGVAMLAATLIVSIDADLATVPTWAWFAVGGVTLLGAAVLIERVGRTGVDGLRELARRWQ
jgi:hypothetical protein